MNALFLTPTTQVINLLMPTLLALIPDDIMKIGLDKLIDSIEDAIAKSPTKVDDALVLPILSALRVKLQVPDNDA